MWIQGSEMYILVTLFILARLFISKDKGKPVDRSWDSEEAMIAPGLEDRVSQNRWHKTARTSTPDISQPT
jgi:hypothetical protein